MYAIIKDYMRDQPGPLLNDYGGQRPEIFILNWYRKERPAGGPFSTKPSDANRTPDNLVVGNLDKFIKAGIDPNLKPDHIFYGRIIPPRELVYYIRRKYGISSAPDQQKNYKIGFKQYHNQFLFDNKLSPTTERANDILRGYKWALNRIDIDRTGLLDRNFEQRRTADDINAGWFPVMNGGETFSEQAFINRTQQYNISIENSTYGDRKQIVDYWLELCYNSINTQKLFAHWRAIQIIDEINKWGGVVDRGLKSGNIIQVDAEIAKKGEESKILTPADHSKNQGKMNPTILALKQETKPKVIQFISNIPSNPHKQKIEDVEYHTRSWNEKRGEDEPLFQQPEFSSDFDDPDVSGCDKGNPYFMRNLIRPKISHLLNPTKYHYHSDKDEAAMLLTLMEVQNRLTKDPPFLNGSLLNKDYAVIRDISINLDAGGKPIGDAAAIEKYFKKNGIDYKIYSLKKDLAPYLYATVFGLGLAHSFSHLVATAFELRQGSMLSMIKGIGRQMWAKDLAVASKWHSYANGIRAFEKVFEPIAVGFKVISAIASYQVYGDDAARLAVIKEVSVGGLALENVFFGGVAKQLFAGSTLIWTGILIAISLYVDTIIENIRERDTEDKFKNLFKEAHAKGYIEGVYAETGGELRILKKDVKNIRLSSTVSSLPVDQLPPVGETQSENDSFIRSDEELMGPKGNRLFWERISKNPKECEALLKIAGEKIHPPLIPGISTPRYNPLLNQAPNQKDYGVFTTDRKFGIDPPDIFMPGSYNRASKDSSFVYINAPLANGKRFNFKYTRAANNIQSNTDLVKYLTGIEESSEGVVITVLTPVGQKETLKLVLYTQKTPTTDKEKVWLIRTKYGLSLLNEKAGADCCNAKKPINSDISPKNFPSDNINYNSDNSFLTGKSAQVRGTTGEPKPNKFAVGCEYIVDMASSVVIDKLKEICGKKKEVDPTDKTPHKKTITPTPKTSPVRTYDKETDKLVEQKLLNNYTKQVGDSATTLNRLKGISGVNDPSATVNSHPRFGQKADVEIFKQKKDGPPAGSVSAWLANLATMDIHGDLKRFANTLATAWATSHSSKPVDNNKINYFAALDTPWRQFEANSDPLVPGSVIYIRTDDLGPRNIDGVPYYSVPRRFKGPG